MSETRKPHRAFTLRLEVEADDREALCGYLTNFVTELYMDKITSGVSGGYSAGATYSLTIDPGMTHERWVVDLEAYIASLDANKAA
jgi:hypothetical protein